MERIAKKAFKNEVVRIDDTIFADCLLIDCTLEYSGSPVAFERTEMRGCRYVFFGPARRTVHFLQATGLLPNVPGEWAEMPDLIH